ncbi:DUF4235 domain-containing protein [Aporhodopirellula aestuarii]|uniref:DUF4235 domain-containing protein n=1 Tax=Aporhodopirellula aestuarii TaxID=2950107 RepID=A0ABT0U3K9_9BACT|nr:DUF4235 domain-containing protein [Aporhodopirellula aestuarii]MCM2371433.1 DUF4235 domain-containing protein [Aporhodopirellula aestuarii]
MLDRIQEKTNQLTERAESYLPSNSKDRNLGITKTENVLAFGAAIATTFLVRNALQAGWKTTFNRAPPKNPASLEVDWKDALLWGAVSGAVVGMARIASRRTSSSAYRAYRS